MVQSGQAAKAIKKKTDAMPKAGAKKLLKDAALTAVTFAGPGKFTKGAKVVKEGVVAAERLARKARGGSATASRMQKASKSTDASRREAIRRADNAVKEAGVESAKIPSPTRVVKLEPRKPQPATETFKVAQRNIRKNVAGVDKPKAKIPTSEVTAIVKERTLRPSNSGRIRAIKKPSSKELSPSEKAADILSKESPVTLTRKRPMTAQQIRIAKAKERKAKFDKVLATRPKPKPNRAPLKPIDKSRGSNRPVKPRLSGEDQILDNAKNNPRNWDIADQRPKATIDKGRGNIEQPPSITKDPRPFRTEKRSVRVEARNTRRAEKRDRRTDIRESKTPGFEKLQPVKRGVPRNAEQRAEGRANAEARAALAAKAKKGSKMSKRSTTNDPRNTASDAGNMREKLKAIDKLTAARAKNRSNKVSPELKAKVNATLGSSNKAKKGKALQNTFNKPKFSRNVTTGKLRATRPIKPVKK